MASNRTSRNNELVLQLASALVFK